MSAIEAVSKIRKALDNLVDEMNKGNVEGVKVDFRIEIDPTTMKTKVGSFEAFARVKS